MQQKVRRSRDMHTYITVVGGGHNILKLLGSENINSNKMTLSMTVLSSLGSRNFHNLLTI